MKRLLLATAISLASIGAANAVVFTGSAAVTDLTLGDTLAITQVNPISFTTPTLVAGQQYLATDVADVVITSTTGAFSAGLIDNVQFQLNLGGTEVGSFPYFGTFSSSTNILTWNNDATTVRGNSGFADAEKVILFPNGSTAQVGVLDVTFTPSYQANATCSQKDLDKGRCQGTPVLTGSVDVLFNVLADIGGVLPSNDPYCTDSGIKCTDPGKHIPEPASLFVISIGLLGLGFVRYRLA